MQKNRQVREHLPPPILLIFAEKELFYFEPDPSQQEMWGVFTERKKVNVFVFVAGPNSETHEVKLDTADHNPLLVFAEYMVRFHNDTNGTVTIIDGRRKPWCIGVQEALFPGMEYQNSAHSYLAARDTRSSGYFTFDMDFHITRLIHPRRPVLEYYHMVANGEFQRLVYKYGGVDPTQLRRFLPDEDGCAHPLVEEAQVILDVTKCMKSARRVWMSAVHLGNVLTTKDPKWLAACRRLMNAKVFTTRGELLAFTWAADIWDRYKDLIIVECEWGIAPITVNEKTAAVTKVDPSMPMDKWIDAHFLSNQAFLDTEPGVAGIKGLDSGYFNMHSFAEFADMIAFTNKVLSDCPLPSIVISLYGNIGFGVREIETCIVTHPIVPFAVGDIVTVHSTVQRANSSCAISETLTSVFYDSQLFPCVRSITALKFEDTAYIKKSIYIGHVFVVCTRSVDERWYHECKRFASEGRNNVYFLKFGKP